MSTEVYEAEEFDFKQVNFKQNQAQLLELNGVKLNVKSIENEQEIENDDSKDIAPTTASNEESISIIISFILYFISPSNYKDILNGLFIGTLKVISLLLLLSVQFGIDIFNFSWNGLKSIIKIVLYF
ncbi:hypothetical protein KGF54_002911 [Candida jiufengensis]|uniref:uncharacterized protein n=1 Tax=Candida jiufengensis TaxID=497108 RepID=UPI00222425C3|nr:uncharacterized protein KGF54_002911 [Candida jiufengensis]KAI5953539.1 hypothetical protein KGF54_002911 [Candida jiufengensis]